MKGKLIIALIFSQVLVANAVWAGFVTGPLVPCGTSASGYTDCTLCHLWQLISNIFNFLVFNISIPLATLLFIIAGVLMLVSSGSEEKVLRAKKIFTNTVIGLIIVFCAWLIIDTLIKTVAVSFSSVVWSWNSFPSCQ